LFHDLQGEALLNESYRVRLSAISEFLGIACEFCVPDSQGTMASDQKGVYFGQVQFLSLQELQPNLVF
jgi:hypothetical protein